MKTALRWITYLTVLVTALGAISACGLQNRSQESPGATIEQPMASPSGQYHVFLETKTDDKGLVWIVPTIKDSSGTSVYVDNGYARRHSLLVMWEDERDVLWIVSSDVGTSKVEIVDGNWVKEWDSNVPPEVEKAKQK